MSRTVLWLLASLGLACFTAVTDATPLKVMSAPNLLRVGTVENIFVECQDCAGKPAMNVEITAWNYPTKNLKLNGTSVILDAANKYQALGEFVIPPGSFEKNPKVKQYVYLKAAFPGFTLEKVVLVSFQSGYMFIQTDKTLYTPESMVSFRIFALTPGMKPIGRDDASGNAASITVEIVTPEGIVIPQDPVSLKDGMHSGTYRLGEIVSIGQWKIRSKFQSNPQESYSAEFEVKKYVLPSYEVKLTPEIAFFYFDSDSFQVSIKANYLFGKAVNGMAYVVFGVMEGEIRKVFPSSLQRIPINDGAGEAFLRKQHIIQTFPNKETLVGKSLFVTAMVHTESGSEMVEGEIRNIQIVKSPYVLNFDKTPKYFKPGMSFDVTVTVTNPDGSPAEGVPVVLSSGPNIHGTTRANGRTTLTVNTRSSDKTLTVTAKTNDERLPNARQTEVSMVARPHETKSNSYIHINILSTDVTLGTDLKVHLNLNSNTRQFEITYLILSRGQLVDFGRQLSDGQVTVVMIIPVTKKMLPSFRIIVYYHPTPSEVVSDSIWVDVDDSCMGTLKLEPKFPVVSYEPRRTFNLKVTGDPGATVGLVAVDKGVYVLNKKHLLTQKKVWEIVEKADTGCTPGGGRNSMGVFFDAGLLFQTDTAEGTAYRQEVKCSAHARKKRASTLFDVRTTLVSTYSNSLQRECCLDGMKNTPLSYDCATRKRYITDGKECEDAFLYCCEELAKQRSELKEDNLILARSEEDNSYMDSSEIISRTNFPESWQWVTFKIPQCGKRDCQTEMGIPLKDSITTWVFTGISLSQNTGICVGKPLDVVVYKEFFLDLKLPYSAVVGEQIELRAIIHNYIQDEVTVRIELIETPNVCSAASKRGKFTQEVRLGPSSTRAVMFVIIPMEKGSLRIEVKAAVKNSWHSDGVIKQLLVVPKGVLTKENKIVQINPKGGTQEETINTGISKIEMVPGTPSSTKIFVTGEDQVSPLLETVIGGSAMGKLIVLPTGCGEQNMYHMTKPVIATTYLDNTNQWESVGLGKRSDALSHIKTGFQNEMKYAKPDGSFAVWPNAKSSTWLTAYVVKVFAMASNLVAIPNSAICNAVQWLILNTQKPDGMFTEVKMVYHREYTGDVHGRDSDASLTAFCLIAMQESKRICEPIVNSLPNAVDKSVTYLEKRLPSLTNPYAVTITSYALANENRLNKETLYRFASSERDHWTSPLGHVFSLEATAYALLALVKGRFLEEARPVVRWLTNQQKVGGGYGSTQATIMVYQAVSEYWTVAQEPDYNLDVKLKIPGRANLESFRFTRDNRHTTRTSSNFAVDEHVKLIATGTGEATLTLLTQYYAPPKDTLSNCTRFNLSLDFSLDKVDDNEGDIYKLRADFFFKNPKEAAKMSILDIALPTGFIPINDDLNALSEGRARVLSGWEFNKDLTDKGSLILYKDEIANDRVEELSIRLRQTHKVGILQPGSVSLYEYYDATTKCVKFYHPQRKDGQLLKRCRDRICLCAEENCSMQRKGNIKNQERIAKACESTLTSTIDFVYNAVLDEAVYSESFDTYTMRIENVIKEGTHDKQAQGQLRRFLSFPHCRETLNLQVNKGYLIMGTAEDTLQDKKTNSYEYLLGEKTWIEFWPRGEDCQKDEYRPTCLGIEDLINKYESHGCIAK
ncbi:complement C3-like [Periophthalmus magnuspinnatus]|uniref:complement C3-like n=1 Tax=Periophthalmus magnuspinnatus TaxID=409849 RepID=UPI0024370C63|nr:complement C3-like [Periophthalmus magnuspinnatus]